MKWWKLRGLHQRNRTEEPLEAFRKHSKSVEVENTYGLRLSNYGVLDLPGVCVVACGDCLFFDQTLTPVTMQFQGSNSPRRSKKDLES